MSAITTYTICSSIVFVVVAVAVIVAMLRSSPFHLKKLRQSFQVFIWLVCVCVCVCGFPLHEKRRKRPHSLPSYEGQPCTKHQNQTIDSVNNRKAQDTRKMYKKERKYVSLLFLFIFIPFFCCCCGCCCSAFLCFVVFCFLLGAAKVLLCALCALCIPRPFGIEQLTIGKQGDVNTLAANSKIDAFAHNSAIYRSKPLVHSKLKYLTK